MEREGVPPVDVNRSSKAPRKGALPWIIFGTTLAVTFLLGMLVVSVMERRWEAVKPALVAAEIGEWETDNAVCGSNYPREYESFLQTEETETRTKFGGAYPRDYLDEDPRQVVLFAGYGFSKDFRQGRGHQLAVQDIRETKRTTKPDGTDTGMPGTCWTCKSSQVPKLMHEKGVTGFYNDTWKNLEPGFHSTIGCLDCHDPKTMNLRISRPALREAFARQGRDIDKASHQEMRSLVCAQCHVEYYFGNNPEENVDGEPTFAHKGKYLVFPWDEGTGVEGMEAYYAARPEFFDWIHPVSGTRMVKIQHPDWEVFETGIHAYRNVSCADCHMPYKTEGGTKFTNHHVQSPLLNIAESCGVCHRWSEEEIRARVEETQSKQFALRLDLEDALVLAHFDVAACVQAGVDGEGQARLRDLLWRAQLRWDYVAANNGMGFHSPQECVRTLGSGLKLAQEVRIEAARLLAARGISAAPKYPDISTREKATAVVNAFIGAGADPATPAPPLL